MHIPHIYQNFKDNKYIISICRNQDIAKMWGSRCSPSPAPETTCAISAESKSLPDGPPDVSLSKEVSAGYQHGNKGNTRVRREGASDCLGNVCQDPFRDKAGISTNFRENTTLLPHHSMLLMYGHQDHEGRVLEVEARSARGSEEIRASTRLPQCAPSASSHLHAMHIGHRKKHPSISHLME